MNDTFIHNEDIHWYDSEIKTKVKELLDLAKQNLNKEKNFNSNVIIIPHAGIDYSGYCVASVLQNYLNNFKMKKKRSKNKKKRSKNRIKYNNKFNQIVILSTHHNNQNKLIFPSGNIHKGNYRNIKIPEFKIYNFVKN